MTLDFRSFVDNKPSILRANPDAIDLTETNIVAALNHLRPNPPPELFPEKAHRCHLAEFWLDAFDLPRTLKPQTLISQGVRSSLGLLFAIYAGLRLNLKVPSDVYPVYLEIAVAAGLDVTTYFASETITPQTLGNADAILLTDPLKPWGRRLSENELDVLKTWLSHDNRRRVIVDAVYTWESQLHAMAMALFEKGASHHFAFIV